VDINKQVELKLYNYHKYMNWLYKLLTLVNIIK